MIKRKKYNLNSTQELFTEKYGKEVILSKVLELL